MMLVHLSILAILLQVAIFSEGKSLRQRGKRLLYHPAVPQKYPIKDDHYYPQVDGQPIYVPPIGHSAEDMKELLDYYYNRNEAFTPEWASATPDGYNSDDIQDYSANLDVFKDSLEEGHQGNFHLLPTTKRSILSPTADHSKYLAYEDLDHSPEIFGKINVKKHGNKPNIPYKNSELEYADEKGDNLDKYFAPEIKKVESKPKVQNSKSQLEYADEKSENLEYSAPEIAGKSNKKSQDGDTYVKTKSEIKYADEKSKGTEEYNAPEIVYRTNMKPKNTKMQQSKSELKHSNKEMEETDEYELPEVVSVGNAKKSKDKAKQEIEYVPSQSDNYDKSSVQKDESNSKIDYKSDDDYEKPVVIKSTTKEKVRGKHKGKHGKLPVMRKYGMSTDYALPRVEENISEFPDKNLELLDLGQEFIPVKDVSTKSDQKYVSEIKEKIEMNYESKEKPIKTEPEEKPQKVEKVMIKTEQEKPKKVEEKGVIKTDPKEKPYEIEEKEVKTDQKEKVVTKPKEKHEKVKEKIVIKAEPKEKHEKVKEKVVIKTEPKEKHEKVKVKVVIKTEPKEKHEKVEEKVVIKTKEKVVIKTGPKEKPEKVKEKVIIKTTSKKDFDKHESEKSKFNVEEGDEDEISNTEGPILDVSNDHDPNFAPDSIVTDEFGDISDLENLRNLNEAINVDESESDFGNIGSGAVDNDNPKNLARLFPNADSLNRLSALNSNIWSLIFNPNAERNKLKKCITRGNETGYCTYIQHCEVPNIATSLEELIRHACVMDDVFIGVCCPEFPVESVKVQWDHDPSNSQKQTEDEFIQNTDDCGIRSSEATKMQAWPWQAPLLSMSNGKIFCGGVVINDEYILTAAHCTTKIPRNQILVRLGQYNESTGDDFAVVEIKRHAQYNSRTMHHDIALLKLGRRIVMDEFTGAICLPEEDDDDEHDEETALLLGWRGVFGKKSKSTESLKIIDNTECKKKLRMNLSSAVLCTEARNEEERTCNADSGAPLVIEDDDKYEVIGILGWNRNDCDQRFPSTFSKISSYIDWIRKHAV